MAGLARNVNDSRPIAINSRRAEPRGVDVGIIQNSRTTRFRLQWTSNQARIQATEPGSERCGLEASAEAEGSAETAAEAAKTTAAKAANATNAAGE